MPLFDWAWRKVAASGNPVGADIPASFTSSYATATGYNTGRAGVGASAVQFNPAGRNTRVPKVVGGGGPYPDPGAVGKQPWQNRLGRPISQKGVSAIASFSRQPYRAVKPPLGTESVNVINPVFGRPGFTYSSHTPSTRMGPVPKLAPGSGQTGKHDTRSAGFVPAGYAAEQIQGVSQYDYTPATNANTTINIPRSLPHVPGTDGVELMGTYRAHDFTPASRFFNQARSSAMWQDVTFGPEYRYLVPQQQVARYNLYNDIALARQLAPSYYQLSQTISAKNTAGIGGSGSTRPLGY